MTISKSFTAVGAGGALSVKDGDKFTWAVSGTWVGTWELQKTTDGGNTWTVESTGTDNATGTVFVKNRNQGQASYRFYCRLFTSGTVVTAIAEVVTEIVQEFKNKNGVVVATITEEGFQAAKLTVDGAASVGGALSVAGAFTPAGTQKRIISKGAKAGTTAGWVVGAGNNVGNLATLPASQTASTLVIPVDGLKVGDTITGFHLIGQVESAGGTVTLDADLRKLTAAAADLTDASVGAITQLAVIADTILSDANTRKASLTEVVAANETFYVLVTVTNDASTDIDLMGVAIEFTEQS